MHNYIIFSDKGIVANKNVTKIIIKFNMRDIHHPVTAL